MLTYRSGPASAALALAALLLSASATAGKLADAARATREPSSPSTPASPSGGSSCDYHSSRKRADSDLAVWIVGSPWLIPYAALEPTHRGPPVFEDYPYAGGSNGLLRYAAAERDEGVDETSASYESVESGLPATGKSVVGQVQAEGGYILGGVYRGGLGARLMTPMRLELDINLHGFAEPLPGKAADSSSFANAHLGLRFAQSERVQFHTGLGYQQYADGRGIETGIDFFYGFEAELGAHLILAASGNLGSAGHALVGQARATLGVMVGRVEIYAGYDHISIGGVLLGGPAAGDRAWL